MFKLNKLKLATAVAILGVSISTTVASAIIVTSAGYRGGSVGGPGIYGGYRPTHNPGSGNWRPRYSYGNNGYSVGYVNVNGNPGTATTPASILLNLRSGNNGSPGSPIILTGPGSPGLIIHRGPFLGR